MKYIYLLLILCAAALLLRFYFAFGIFHGDVYNHIEWGIYAAKNGLLGIYERSDALWQASAINQPPGTVYIFLKMRLLYEWIGALFWWLNGTIPAFPSNLIHFYESNGYVFFLKLPGIIADIGIGVVIYWIVKSLTTEKKALIASAIYLFNPLMIYNSSWWGQSDPTVNFFMLLAIYFMMRKKPLWIGLCLATSLFIKASLLIFLPLLLYVLWRQRYTVKQYALMIGLPLVLIVVATLPFHPFNDPLWFFRIYKDTVVFGTLTNVTENAFNFWAVIFGTTQPQPASTTLLGLSAIYWGYLLLGIVYVGVFLKLKNNFTLLQLVSGFIVTAFAAFFFLTGMHERYLYPIFPLLPIVVVFWPQQLWIYISATVLNFLNVYNLWWAPRINWLVSLLEKPEVPMILSFLLYVVFAMCFYWVLSRNKALPSDKSLA